MRRRRLATVLIMSALALTAAMPTAAAGRSTFIVTLRDGVAVDSTVAAHGRAHALEVQQVYHFALHGYAARMSAADAAALAADPSVASVTPDHEVSIAAQTVPTGINRIDGELSSTLAGNGSGAVDVDVAVID